MNTYRIMGKGLFAGIGKTQIAASSNLTPAGVLTNKRWKPRQSQLYSLQAAQQAVEGPFQVTLT